MALIWPVTLINYVCPYNQSFFNGSFAVQKDTWNDFAAGDLVPVSAGPGANQITLTLYPSAAAGGTNRHPFVANVDPLTDSVQIPLQPIGDYPGDPNFSLHGSGVLSACTGTISLTVYFSSPGDGDIPDPYNIVLSKQ